MTTLALLAAMALAQIRNEPVNRLEFVTSQIAGMGRMMNGFFTCVALVNGRPGGRGDNSICYLITNAGAYDIVQRAGAGAQFEAVLAIAADGAPPPPPPPDMAIAIATASARMMVRPDGSIATCTDGPIRIIQRVPGFRDLPPLCESYPAGREQVFTDASAGTAPRTAQLRINYYLRQP